jgi:toxin ParE1/3/4
MRVRFAARARNDIEEIYSYIAEKNPVAAKHVKAAILATVKLVASRPYVGLRNARATELRSRLVSRYPYRIHYLVRGQDMMILHIRHGARRPLETT